MLGERLGLSDLQESEASAKLELDAAAEAFAKSLHAIDAAKQACSITQSRTSSCKSLSPCTTFPTPAFTSELRVRIDRQLRKVQPRFPNVSLHFADAYLLLYFLFLASADAY